MEAEYERLQQQEQQAFAAIRQKGDQERTKGLAVQNQQVRTEDDMFSTEQKVHRPTLA